MVPEGWSQFRLGDVGGSAKHAIVDGPFGSNLKSEHYRKAGIPVFQSGFVTSGKFKATNYVYVDKELFEDQKRSAAKGGDILMAKIGAQAGRCALIPQHHEVGILAGNCLKITVDEKQFDKRFLLLSLEAAYEKNGLADIKSTTAQPAISLKNLKAKSIIAPRLSEQKKIAEILSTWDQAIETTGKLIANSEAQKRALMQQLLTGKRRLKGFERSEWSSIQLSDIASVTLGSSPPSSAYNDDGLGMPLLQGNADIQAGLSYPRAYTKEITQVCVPGDSLLSVRAPVGSIARSQHKACIGRGLAAVRSKTKSEQEWLHQLLLWIAPKWKTLAQGSTFEAINGADIRSFMVPVPEMNGERIAIGMALSFQDKLIQAAKNDIRALRDEKRALMQQLLTGKRRVTV